MPIADELAVYARVRAEMDRLADHAEIPADIRDFLLNQWTRLMTGLFMARGDQDADWRAGWETANGLVYSLLPKHSVAETEQFLRELPRLLWRLHEGCTALGLPNQQRDALFSHLAVLHAGVAREGLQIGQSAVDPHLGEVYEPEPEEDEAFALPAEAEPQTAAKSVEEVASQATPEKKAPTEGVPVLSTGDRVCFRHDSGERILVLTGKSPMGGMYMFTNEDGLDAMTYTHGRLAAKFRSGEARLVGHVGELARA